MADYRNDLYKDAEALEKKNVSQKAELGGKTSSTSNVDGTDNEEADPSDAKIIAIAKAQNNSKKPKKVLTQKDLAPNELHEFNSMNYMFGLYCLTTDEILDPDNTYMKAGKEPEVVVIKSGGGTRNVGNRKAMTSLEKAGGRVEYFIDNVTMKSL